MATKNIVPNDNGEGGIGTSSKYWATGYIDAITTTGNLVVGGNTGIGDSSPSQKLVVEGDWNQTATNNNQVYIQGSTNSNMQLRLGYDTTGDHGYIQAILNGTGGRELHLNTSGGAVVIADSGTIGCASDTDLLTLANQSLTVAGALTVSGAGNSAFSGPLFISHSSGDSLTLTKDTTEPSLRLEGDSNKDFVITVNGELLTFTQNDGATDILTLDHDTKNATFGGNIAIPRTFNDTNNAVIYIDSTINSGASTYQGSLLLQAGGAGSASYGSGLRLYGHAHASSPGSVEVGLSAVSGAKFTIDTYGAGGGTDLVTVERDNGNVTVSTGNLIIGTAGKGIDFSAETPSESGAGAVSSSILDDYEEGTWTPTVVSAGNGNVATSNSTYTKGFYTKIGRMVHCSGYIVLTSLNSGTGSVEMGGYPFINQDAQGAQSSGVCGVGTSLNITAGQSVFLVMRINEHNAGFSLTDSTGGTTEMQGSEFSDNGQVQFSITYMTDS